MKKLLLSFVVAAFAVAVQAGNEGTCSAGGSCCAVKKTGTQAKAECPMTKQAKAKKGASQASAKQTLKSPKANG